MPQNRLYWAVQAVGFKPDGDENAYTPLHGGQTIGLDTAFNLEQYFELGQQEVYENVEGIPDISVSVEKVLDGYPTIYHLATEGATNDTLAGRGNVRTIMAMSVYDDTFESASGTPLLTVECSGLYVSSLSYSFPVEGAATESVTLVGNDKRWSVGGATLYGDAFDGTIFDNTDEPLALAASGGIQFRENFKVGDGESRFPTEIPGIDGSGYNQVYNGRCEVSIQNVSVSADLGRSELFELGKKNPYFRYVDFPVEVTTDIEIMAKSGDMIDANSDSDNLTNQAILIKMEEGLQIDCGSRNKLSNVSYGGGDAGGGNATITYSYVGYNNMTVSHPQSP